MSLYRVKFYTGEYAQRQRAANSDDAVCYIEHHFNAGSAGANYAVTVVATNSGKKTRDWARVYAKAVAKVFNIHVSRDTDRDPANDGVFVGGWDGKRGNANLIFTLMPAVLLEPLFASNPTHAKWIRSAEGRRALARVLVDTIKHFFPKGGLVAFSVGHKYKLSNPNDRGAPVVGGGTEAEYAEMVLQEARLMLEA